jgi:hypothetical protein
MTFAFDLCPCFIFYDRAIISCRSRNTFQLIMHNLTHTKKKFEQQLLFYCYESVFVPGMLRIAWHGSKFPLRRTISTFFNLSQAKFVSHLVSLIFKVGTVTCQVSTMAVSRLGTKEFQKSTKYPNNHNR